MACHSENKAKKKAKRKIFILPVFASAHEKFLFFFYSQRHTLIRIFKYILKYKIEYIKQEKKNRKKCRFCRAQKANTKQKL